MLVCSVKPVSTSTRNCFDRTIIKYFCGRESEGYSHATLKFPCMWLMERWLGSWEVSYGDSEVGLITGRPSIRWKKACEIFIAFYYSAGTM